MRPPARSSSQPCRTLARVGLNTGSGAPAQTSTRTGTRSRPRGARRRRSFASRRGRARSPARRASPRVRVGARPATASAIAGRGRPVDEHVDRVAAPQRRRERGAGRERRTVPERLEASPVVTTRQRLEFVAEPRVERARRASGERARPSDRHRAEACHGAPAATREAHVDAGRLLPRMAGPRLVLVTGATGYVGGRLLRALEERGERVRCLSRRPDVLAGRVGPRTEVVGGDVRRPETLAAALAGVDTAYYLVHSMTRRGAVRGRRPRRCRGVRRGRARGRGPPDRLPRRPRLRPPLAAPRIAPGGRARAARVRRADDRVPRVDRGRLRQRLVRHVRALVERLPVMVTPRWVTSRRSRSRSRTSSTTCSPRSTSRARAPTSTRSAARTPSRTAS